MPCCRSVCSLSVHGHCWFCITRKCISCRFITANFTKSCSFRRVRVAANLGWQLADERKVAKLLLKWFVYRGKRSEEGKNSSQSICAFKSAQHCRSVCQEVCISLTVPHSEQGSINSIFTSQHWVLLRPFCGPLSETSRVSRYQKEHSPAHLSWLSTILYQLLPSTTIHSILRVQFTCTTIFLHNLSPSPLWSTS